MIKYQDNEIIIHEIKEMKEIDQINGASSKPQVGDLEKYSLESKVELQGTNQLWFNGFATSFECETMYVIEYLTGDYIGVGVDNKDFINEKYELN